MRIEDLSAGEREVMEIVWELGEVTAKQARDALCAKWRAIPSTLLERMEEKGWVTHREIGRTYVYRAARPRNESIGRKVRRDRRHRLWRITGALVAALLDFRGLRAAELHAFAKCSTRHVLDG